MPAGAHRAFIIITFESSSKAAFTFAHACLALTLGKFDDKILCCHTVLCWHGSVAEAWAAGYTFLLGLDALRERRMVDNAAAVTDYQRRRRVRALAESFVVTAECIGFGEGTSGVDID